MKPAVIFLLAAGLAVSGSPARALDIFVSIPPQAALLDAVTGGLDTVHVLMKPGDSPHTYEPSPRQMMDLGGADLFFTMNMPFESFIRGKIAQSSRKLDMVDCTAGIPRRVMKETHGDAHETAVDARDPHVWMDPLNLIVMARNMANALADRHPEKRTVYMANLKALTARIRQAHDRIRTLLAPLKGDRFYVYHPAFGYFADRYGLEQVAVETGGKSPSPRQLSQLIRQARGDGVRIIFVQSQFDPRSARTVATAIHGVVEPVNPMARDTLGVLEKLAETMQSAGKDPGHGQ